MNSHNTQVDSSKMELRWKLDIISHIFGALNVYEIHLDMDDVSLSCVQGPR